MPCIKRDPLVRYLFIIQLTEFKMNILKNNYNLNKFLFFSFTLFFICLFNFTYAKTHYVLVSVAPYRFFVEKIAGDTVKVGLMVPAGASAHTYEPTPKETLAASYADLWFLIGESFETRAVNAIKSHHPSLVLVDLRDNVRLISSDPNHAHADHCCCHKNCQDLHIWLSPRESQTQAKTIAKALIELYPEHSELYEANLQKFLTELQTLDTDLETALKPINNRVFLVSHPAYGYFVRDYGMIQLSIEFEGKDPTPRQLTRVFEQARDNKIKTIFVQRQYSNKGARLIASKIGANVVNLDPYSEDYLNSMRDITREIVKSKQ